MAGQARAELSDVLDGIWKGADVDVDAESGAVVTSGLGNGREG